MINKKPTSAWLFFMPIIAYGPCLAMHYGHTQPSIQTNSCFPQERISVFSNQAPSNNTIPCTPSSKVIHDIQNGLAFLQQQNQFFEQKYTDLNEHHRSYSKSVLVALSSMEKRLLSLEKEHKERLDRVEQRCLFLTQQITNIENTLNEHATVLNQLQRIGRQSRRKQNNSPVHQHHHDMGAYTHGHAT